jgi:hypothetical protein
VIHYGNQRKIFADDNKPTLDYSNQVEICVNTDDDNSVDDDHYEPLVSMRDDNNKALKTNKNFQIFDR